MRLQTGFLRFGPFEFDVRAGELRKHGIRIKLREQPVQVLVMLLEHPGEVVLREEIRLRLWPDNTVIEFDHGINTAVQKLRNALGESADNPRYIETVARRGYRFMGEVQQPTESESQPPPELAARSANAPEPRNIAPPRRTLPKYIAAAAVAALMLLTAVLWWRQRAQTGPLSSQDVLVLADFTNTTGDPVFDVALRQALSFELEQSPFLKIMDEEEVNQTLQLMGRPAGQPITNEIAREICVREGQKATIGGSIASLGRTYQIVLQATNCQSGASLVRQQNIAEDKEHVLKALSKAAEGIRATLGESLSHIERPEWPGRDAAPTTGSLEAFQAYALGVERMARGQQREAIPHLERAVELDPEFARAYEVLSQAYRATSQSARARECLTKAFALVDRVNERERLLISGLYYTYVTGELNKAIDTYQVAIRSDPRNARPHNRLFSIYRARGEYERALAEIQEAIRLQPGSVVYSNNLVGIYVALDRFDEARAVAKRTIAQKLDNAYLHTVLLSVAYILDDHSAQQNEVAWFAGKPEEYRSVVVQADNALALGQRHRAKELYQRAAEMARREDPTALPVGVPFAEIDAWMGDCEAARREKENFARELCGDPAALHIAEQQAAKRPPPNPDFGVLPYERGLAGLRAGKGSEAAAEFRKILAHKGRNQGPHYPLAYLGLGRALTLTGDSTNASQAYRDFLAVWKDADPDIPVLIAARKEYAALHPD